MVDTYLREAQVIVLRGQVAVMEKLRSGEEIGSLEGFPLGEVPTRVPEEGEGVVSQKDHSGEASQKESSGVPACGSHGRRAIHLPEELGGGQSGGFDPKMMPDMVLFPKELRDNEIQEVSAEAMPLALAEEAPGERAGPPGLPGRIWKRRRTKFSRRRPLPVAQKTRRPPWMGMIWTCWSSW